MGAVLDAYGRSDLAAVNAQLLRTCQRLADAGCDFFVCPDNTAHIAIDAATAPFPIPGLHIADIVAGKALSERRQRVALLGTRWTMEGPSYSAAFARVGVALVVPEAKEREIIDRIIFEELCQGVITDDSRAEFVRIIERMKCDGCDAVALSCTEIPLLVTPEASPLPTLDSTRLLARAAVAAALA
jgi:aspartate racemase